MYQHPIYPNLFKPLRINKLMLANRIFYAPVENYEDRALAGAAVMMRGTSGTLEDRRCRLSKGKWLFADSEIPRITKELTIIRRGGSLTELEIMHAGNRANVDKGDFVWGPSDDVRADGVTVKALDKEMMNTLIEDYANTAFKAKQIGYDMVMMHFAHGWLPSQFMSPGINHRSDEYGGSYDNRVRFPKEILRAVRKKVGRNYPVDMRISYYEDFDGAVNQDEVIRFIKECAEEGLIDCVNVSYGLHEGPDSTKNAIPGPFAKDCTFADGAKKIKEAVDIPVIVAGKILTPEEAEYVIKEGKADAVVVGRATIADPYWAKKAFEGRSDEIIPCIHCGKCFDKRCSVQLRNYMENLVPKEGELPKIDGYSKCVIVGGGPAGMKCALTAYERGYDVTLYEASDRLGGLLKVVDNDENKRELKRYKDYLIHMLSKTDVRIILNTKPDHMTIEKDNPDILILAMGSVPNTPPIKGVENAIQALDAHYMNDLGHRIVFIGGGLVGSEFAITLALRSHDVSVIDISDNIGGRFDNTTFKPYDLMNNLSNLHMYPNTNTLEIGKNYVVIENEDGNQKIECDNVILSTGFRSNNDNLSDYYGICPKTICIGDLRRPATIRETVEEAYFAVSGQ